MGVLYFLCTTLMLMGVLYFLCTTLAIKSTPSGCKCYFSCSNNAPPTRNYFLGTLIRTAMVCIYICWSINQSSRWGIREVQIVNAHACRLRRAPRHLVSPSCNHLRPTLKPCTHTIVYFVLLSIVKFLLDIAPSHSHFKLMELDGNG